MKLPSGSYSLYNQFENCPHKAFHMYVLKDLPRIESPEMKWGNDVHSAMERRIKDGTPLPKEMIQAEPVAAKVHTLKADGFSVKVEYQLAMNVDGTKADYWQDPWFRGKLDIAVRSPQTPEAAWLVDWKTGKVREEPMELETGAMLLAANHPELTTILGEYFWMQTGRAGLRYTLTPVVNTFNKVHEIRDRFEDCFRTGDWPKTPNPLCGWCAVLSCEHNKSHRRK